MVRASGQDVFLSLAFFLDVISSKLGVTVQPASTAIQDPLTILIVLASLFLLFCFKLNSSWLIAAGSLIGIIHTLL